MLLNQNNRCTIHTCTMSAAWYSWDYSYAIPWENSYQETRGKSLLISLHSDKSPATCADKLQCVWNNGDPGECYICSWKMSSTYIQINGCAVDLRLRSKMLHLLQQVWLFWPNIIQNMGNRCRQWSKRSYQMTLWPYNNSVSIMPQQTSIWQRRNRKTTNTACEHPLFSQDVCISLDGLLPELKENITK